MLGSEPGTGKPTKLKIAPKPTHWEVRLPVLEPKSSRRIRIITVGRPWSSRLPRVVTPLNSASQSIVLAAHDAIVVGKNLRYEPQPHKNTVGYWNRVEDWCWWSVYVERPGRYEVRVMQGCGTGHGGSRVSVGLAGQKMEFTVEDTGGFQAFRTRSIGEVTISRSGLYRLEIRPISKKSVAVMDVRQVQLVWRAGR
jgi:hypothetical protein